MASAGRKPEDEDIVSYILTGLGVNFDSVMSTVTAWVEPISVHDLYAQLMNHEQRKEARDGGSSSFDNMVTMGGRGGGNHNSNKKDGNGRGNHGGFTRGGKGGRGGGGRGPNF